MLERVPTKKCDVVKFMATALTHGALPWQKEGERRTLVMGYIHNGQSPKDARL